MTIYAEVVRPCNNLEKAIDVKRAHEKAIREAEAAAGEMEADVPFSLEHYTSCYLVPRLSLDSVG